MELTYAGKEILPYIEDILQAEYNIKNYGKSLEKLTGILKIAML